MLTIHFFASFREALGKQQEQLELPAVVNNVGELLDHLATRDPALKELLQGPQKLLIAVNQTVVDRAHLLSADDEIALFPPMTGG